MSFRAFSATLWLMSVAFLLYVAILSLIGDVSSLPLVGNILTRPHRVVQASAIFILLFFAWVLLELALKKRQVDREQAALATFTNEINKTDPATYVAKALNNPKAPRALRRLDLVMECRRGGGEAGLHEGLPAAAALDASAFTASYVPLQVYAWILPVLGFIGTASGMASAIDGFKDALGDRQVAVGTLAANLSQTVIPELAAAFETTILALAAALVAYLCTWALRNRDQQLLIRLDWLCVLLLLRIPHPTTPDGVQVLAFLKQISEQLQGVLQVPAALTDSLSGLKDASAAIGAAAAALSSVTPEFATGASANRSAAEALVLACKELQESVSADYQFTIKRTPRT